MTKRRLIAKPTKIEDIPFEDLYDEISRDWEGKARALQIRRWRALKHEIKHS